MEAKINRTCKKCGKQFSISSKQQRWFEHRSLALPTHCSTCIEKSNREKSNRIEYATCKTCNGVFGMNALEIEWYLKNGLMIPKRCPECREKKNVMNVFTIEDVHDINIDIDILAVKIDFQDVRGSAVRIELSKKDALLLHEKLSENLAKE